MAVQCVVQQCSVMQCSTAESSSSPEAVTACPASPLESKLMSLLSGLQFRTALCSAVQSSERQCSMFIAVLLGAVMCSAVQFRAITCNAVKFRVGCHHQDQLHFEGGQGQGLGEAKCPLSSFFLLLLTFRIILMTGLFENSIMPKLYLFHPLSSFIIYLSLFS